MHPQFRLPGQSRVLCVYLVHSIHTVRRGLPCKMQWGLRRSNSCADNRSNRSCQRFDIRADSRSNRRSDFHANQRVNQRIDRRRDKQRYLRAPRRNAVPQFNG